MLQATGLYVIFFTIAIIMFFSGCTASAERRIAAGIAVIALCTINVLIVAGCSLWAHTFFGDYFWAAMFGAAVGGILVASA